MVAVFVLVMIWGASRIARADGAEVVAAIASLLYGAAELVKAMRRS